MLDGRILFSKDWYCNTDCGKQGTGLQSWNQISVPSRNRNISLSYYFQTGPGVHPASYTVSTGACPLGMRGWSWPSPLSSAGVKACQSMGSYFLVSHHGGPGSFLEQTCDIFGERSETWEGFLQLLHFFPISIFQQLSILMFCLSTINTIQCDKIISSYFTFFLSVFSKNSPYSCFVYLPSTLYNPNKWQHC